MSTLSTENSFASYDMTDQEILEGSKLTITQKQFIQNQLAVVAHTKIALEFDVAEPNKFIQAESYQAGQIAAYQYLLDCSVAAEEETAYRANNPETPQEN